MSLSSDYGIVVKKEYMVSAITRAKKVCTLVSVNIADAVQNDLRSIVDVVSVRGGTLNS